MSREGVQPPPPAPIEIAAPRMRVQLLFLGRSMGRSAGDSVARPARRSRVWAYRGDRLNALVRTKTRILLDFFMRTIVCDGRAARNIDQRSVLDNTQPGS